MWTREKILKQLAESELSVAFALVRLWERQTPNEQDGEHTGEVNGIGFRRQDSEFLSSLAQQVIWRLRDKELGMLEDDVPLLSPRQLEWARRLLPSYWKQLVAIANERAPHKAENLQIHSKRLQPVAEPVQHHLVSRCVHCDQRADGAYNGVPLCGHCLRFEIVQRMEPEYILNEEEQDRLQEELELLGARSSGGTKVMTEALVVQGNNIRFRTAREHAVTRTGLPSTVENELWSPTESQEMIDDWVDDPFVMEEA